MIYVVVLAGGTGTRLWPESRESKAKQFLSFQSGRSMIEATVRRMESFVPDDRVRILTTRAMADRIRTALPRLDARAILTEPVARNTAPCLGLAAVHLLREDPEATMIVLPSDHVITPEPLFVQSLRLATDLVEEDPNRLVTIGIKPTFPSTSYGYIQRSEPLDSVIAGNRKEVSAAYRVLKFHEKPDAERAAEFLRSGRYAWNAGIFVWKARTIFELIRRFEPEIGHELGLIAEAIGTPGEQAVTEKAFESMKSISIDFAVMERADSIVMLEAGFTWDDVGTWCSLDRLYRDRHDSDGNLALGARLLALNSKGCVVRGNDPNHLFALLGLEDILVIQTEDATLLAKKDREESVRDVIAELKSRGWNEFL